MRLAPTAAGVALGAAAGFNIANVGPAADVLADTYGVRLAAIGFLTTALFVTHLAMQIPGGRLVDRRGAWTLGVWALVAVVAGNVIALLAPSFALGIAGRLVAGLGTGAGFVAGSDYVRATVGTPTAQGLYGASGVGGGVLPPSVPSDTYPVIPLMSSAHVPASTKARRRFCSADALAGSGAIQVA